MLSLYNRAKMEMALKLPLRADLMTLLRTRIDQVNRDGLDDLTHIIVIAAGDTEADLKAEVAFSPLEKDGLRFGQPGFQTWWDWLYDHGGWFELIYCVGNSGFAYILFVEDCDHPALMYLMAMCRVARS